MLNYLYMHLCHTCLHLFHVNGDGYSGCSPLHVAAQSGKTECVNRILQHKVHVGSQDGRKMTALHHAGVRVLHCSLFDFFFQIVIQIIIIQCNSLNTLHESCFSTLLCFICV